MCSKNTNTLCLFFCCLEKNEFCKNKSHKKRLDGFHPMLICLKNWKIKEIQSCISRAHTFRWEYVNALTADIENNKKKMFSSSSVDNMFDVYLLNRKPNNSNGISWAFFEDSFKLKHSQIISNSKKKKISRILLKMHTPTL